ncbi:serine protease [Aestuariicoccus sp. MJ-SS9]|uniref:serine protease n=1 Tax=Aestuariicoccus sp. MJ-SS9 TaxID=3079855 RepID=UPI002906E515|nr:serine protease [Aestuariicoccus sp. MJ-SS9]MDU8911945.1 serine protease [Aestuariicoccus sp. MJ-SS9]
MTRFLPALIAVLFLTVTMTATRAAAQQAYIQIEAQPSLTQAEQRVRDYATYLADVNGFALGGGWYGIALGPFAAGEADALRRQLIGQGQIPGDAYLSERADYQRRFWPVGAEAAPAPMTDSAEAAPAPDPVVPDETPRQARASEAQLTRAEREALQVALQWAGFYDAAIDGAFGRGTRRSMAGWQTANGFEPTGILTTRQRAELLRQYNAVLDGLGMRLVTDTRAGISIELPMDALAFDSVEAPFVQYGPTGDLPVRVLLISQPGDRTTMNGLYEIMQTLEIVPLDGERERAQSGFLLTGANARIVSHTEVRLEDGAIKGFTLIWPAGDEERRTRVLALMRQSFATTDAVLDPAAVSGEAQSVDLVSGLRVRKPKVTASGFFVDNGGSVVTSAAAVEACARITIEDDFEMRLAASNGDLGVAVLRPVDALAPRGYAAFQMSTPRLQSEVAVSGYSFGGVLSAPTLTFGRLEDLRGLEGDTRLKRLALASLPGDAGGPVFDTGGAVLGMLLPREDGARQLPDNVSFAAQADEIMALFEDAGVNGQSTEQVAVMAPEDLTSLATGITVLVSCWE